MNIVAIIQARMTSSRLPGKVLKRLGNKTVLEQVLYQLKYSKRLSKIVVATSTDVSDDPIHELCEHLGILCHRGSLNDVLDRFYTTTISVPSNILVRITADCPLIDPEIVDTVIDHFLNGNYDYSSNINPPTFPDGEDVEVFSIEALIRSWKEATLKSEREHVTLFIRNHPDLFKIGNITRTEDLSKLRWTLDNQEDYAFLSNVFENVENTTPYIRMEDVLKLLTQNTSLTKINEHIIRNEGLLRSLKEDKNQS